MTNIKLFISLYMFITLSLGCYSIPQEKFYIHHPLWMAQKSQILQDKRNIKHEYKVVFPTLDNGENVIIYCATHFVWEIITAKYNGNSEKYDYFVVEHPKN